jgi:acyl-CoA thioester hydrolase
VDQRLSYQRELHAGTTVAIRSGIVSVGEKKIIFFHEMRDADRDEVSAVTLLTGVHMDTQLRKACPLPDAVRDAAKSLVVDYVLPWS